MKERLKDLTSVSIAIIAFLIAAVLSILAGASIYWMFYAAFSGVLS